MNRDELVPRVNFDGPATLISGDDQTVIHGTALNADHHDEDLDPIFTQAFVDHARAREDELRTS